MNFKQVFWTFFISVLLNYPLFAQSDTAIYTYERFINSILLEHPLVQQANLKLRYADAELLKSRGVFDPEITASWDEKNFDNKQYYQKYHSDIRIPTPLGVDIVGGYQNANGLYVNPENQTNQYGLWHLGIEVNVLQGLWVNERRTTLQQAKVFQDIAAYEQQILLNQLLYDATMAYLVWQQYYYFNEIYNLNVDLANNYFLNTKASYQSGEKSVMDTLEAFIAYQDAVSVRQQCQIELLKAQYNVENYLWDHNEPVSLRSDIKPSLYSIPMLNVDGFMNFDIQNSPDLLKTQSDIEYLSLEQRLKREKLKPKLKLKYNPLMNNTEPYNVDLNNIKWGVGFTMPIFLRSPRGALKQSNIKIAEKKLTYEYKQNQLQNYIDNAIQKQAILLDQLQLLQQNVGNYNTLLQGEQQKYKYGESSVFMLNKRQEKYIASQLKLIETNVKLNQNKLELLFLSNQLMPQFNK